MATSKYVIGSNALNLDDNNIYTIIARRYKKSQKSLKDSTNNILQIQNSVVLVQKVYLDLITTDSVNIMGTQIKFSDDNWNFSEHFKDGKSTSNYLFAFNSSKIQISDYFKNILKLYTMYIITEFGINCGSNRRRIDCIKNLFEYMSQNNIFNVENLKISNFESFYENKEIKYNSKIKKQKQFKLFFIFYSFIATNVLTREFNDYFSDSDVSVLKALQEDGKTKLLPTIFYQKYCEKLYKTCFDENEKKTIRGYCGLLYIGTQTGLRNSEICILQSGCITEQSFKNKKICILNYRSTKNGSKSNIYNKGTTNASEKVITIVNLLESLFSEERKTLSINLLVPVNEGNNKTVAFRSIQSQTLAKNNVMFCIKHCVELNILNTDESDMFEGSISGRYLIEKKPTIANEVNLKETDIISLPTIKQYRVYFASDLRERGIDDRTIAYLLNHESEAMWGYYVRPKHEVQEDIDFSKEIIAEVIRDNSKILGTKGNAIQEKIEHLIKDNQFNLEKDFEAIVDRVCNEMPIRAKEGGFCIKSNPRRQCRHDAETDEFLCAYGCCPNHCHFYFMAPVSYQKYVNMKKTAQYNIDEGYINQAQKEMYKLESNINQELVPELNELENELLKKGKDVVIFKHPETEFIIDNIEYIKGDIELWKAKIKEMK